MNNVLSSVQMFEAGGNCDKYSKSVSYETLVGGTATTGKDRKQTQRLCEYCADKPLIAIGTLTSLLCNSSKVVEKLFYRHSEPKAKNPKSNIKDWILHFAFAPFRMTFFALILTLITTAESRAECHALNSNWTNTCYDTWNPGVTDNCGNGCTYSYNNGKLTVTATKPNAVVPKGMFSPHYYESGVYPNVTDIEISGEFKSIAAHAFLSNSANIHGKDWVLVTNGSVGSNSFEANVVSGTVIVKDGQTKLGEGPWFRTTFKGTLILPPTITSIDAWTLVGLYLGTNAKIYCGAKNCKQLFSNIDCDAVGKKSGDYWGNLCQTHKEQLLSSGKLLAYPDGCAKMWSTGCIKCKNENFKLNDGECDRLRYTPAEAAEVLRDDNTNEVTITFRK